MPQGTDWLLEDERGDRDAFARLFQREAPVVYSWAAARLQRGERALAEDLVQEVWLRALNLFGSFEGPEGGFRNWLFGIAQRVRLELMRELARQPAGGNWGGSGSRALERVPAEITSISSRIGRDEELQIFLDRIARLPPDELELLELRGFQELSWDEAATELGLNAEVARQRYSRLLARLRQEGAPRWLNG